MQMLAHSPTCSYGGYCDYMAYLRQSPRTVAPSSPPTSGEDSARDSRLAVAYQQHFTHRRTAKRNVSTQSWNSTFAPTSTTCRTTRAHGFPWQSLQRTTTRPMPPNCRPSSHSMATTPEPPPTWYQPRSQFQETPTPSRQPQPSRRSTTSSGQR